MNTPQKIELAESRLSEALQLAKEAQIELQEMRQQRSRLTTNLTHAEAGRMLGVSARTISRMLEDGRLNSTNFTDVYNYKKRP